MIWGAVVLILLLLLGYGLTKFAFGRRPVPDALDPEVLKQSVWIQYEPNISNGAAWLKTQEVREMRVVSYDGKVLFGRFIPAEDPRGTILLFHGYRSHFAVDFSASMKYYHDRGFNLLLPDHRAHGQSEGRWITFGVRERYDVLSWVTYLAMTLGEDHPMLLSGLSMGASTVLMAAELDFPANVRGIIADCGYVSPADILGTVAKKAYHAPAGLAVAFLNIFSHLFCGFGLRDASTTEALANSRLPVALFHGMDDGLVPYEMSRQAYEAAAGYKVLTEFPGADHGVSWLSDPARYKKVLEDFIDHCLSQ